MSTIENSADELVDSFVRYLNEAGFEPRFPAGFDPRFPGEVPEELRSSTAEDGMFHWQIRPSSNNPWIEALVEQLPQNWPQPFRSLIDRYRFCNIEVGPLMLFANTGHDLFYELSSRVFSDKGLFPTLHENGFLQFGLQHEGNYDPVCFVMKRRTRSDAPIVQLDHEEILQWGRIRVVQEIAPSLTQFMRSAVAERFPVS